LAWGAFNAGTPTWIIEAALVALGGGLGWVMPNLTVAIQNAVDRRDLGSATSVSGFVRSLGGALGVAVSGAVVSVLLHHSLPAAWLNTTTSSGKSLLEAGVQEIAAIPPEQHAVLIEAYRHAIATTFITGAGIAALAFFIVLALPERPLLSVTKPGDAPDVDAA
jgi:hypothetical protein